MFKFLFLFSINRGIDFSISEIMNIDVQLFTSDELAICALKSNYFLNIFEVVQSLLEINLKNI